MCFGFSWAFINKLFGKRFRPVCADKFQNLHFEIQTFAMYKLILMEHQLLLPIRIAGFLDVFKGVEIKVVFWELQRDMRLVETDCQKKWLV